MSVRGAEWISDRSRDNSPAGHNSPDGPDGLSGKRSSKKRKVLSCYACRNRKMKCDRVLPVCGRCQRTGRADQCTYDPRLLEEPHANGGAHADGGVSFTLSERNANDFTSADSSDALQWKVRIQERRIAMLERKLATMDSARNPSQYEDVSPEEPEIKEEMMFRGKGFKTQFHGVTSVMSMIVRYHELQTFTREALKFDHSIMRVKTDFKSFRDRRKKAINEQDVRIFGTDEEIFAALPDRSILDVQAALYFHTWEASYRILHEPSFWKEYHVFWEQRPGNKDQASFAVMLVLIVAITKCLTPKDDVFIGDTTADRQAAANLIDMCESWINQQPRKRLTLPFFQLQCLSLLAKRVNCVKLKQDWVTSGDVLRLALASGMHRDPSLLASGRISEFEKEMKRRLWVTIMEFELQSSAESGLQSALTGLYFDTRAPANLPDDAFTTESQQLPTSQPSEQFTSASYISVALKSLPLRINLTQLLNTPSSDLQYSDILHFGAQIHSAISSLPTWDDDRAALPSALLRLQLRQYLLVLHKPYAKLAPRNDRYMYSFTTVVDTCSSIIATHDRLLSRRILALNNFRNDVLRVGLTLSQVVYENCVRYMVKQSSAPPPTTTETPFADPPHPQPPHLPSAKHQTPPDNPPPLYLAVLPQTPFLAKTLCTTSLDILERTRQLFEQKVMRLGTGYMEYWILSAAVGMLPPPPSPATSIAYVTNACDDILSRCKKTLNHFMMLASRVLALQRDQGDSFAVSLRSTMASVSPSEEGRTPGVNTGSFGGGGGMSMETGNASFPALAGMGMGAAEGGTKDFGHPFDMLQDMQDDVNGWSFPDFWAFDLGDDF
ncbi:C6 zinc finger domain-containing protein [Clathrospora elynae]|uniref:C6 zinc finger domain-containing protein n=1 Tax=Clathrospora elynae TaxID=706981 RepID=A0A6A5SS67_9PLEO|nr:C6 zinc finger domain-containing protein [Clathrospora elynae]